MVSEEARVSSVDELEHCKSSTNANQNIPHSHRHPHHLQPERAEHSCRTRDIQPDVLEKKSLAESWRDGDTDLTKLSNQNTPTRQLPDAKTEHGHGPAQRPTRDDQRGFIRGSAHRLSGSLLRFWNVATLRKHTVLNSASVCPLPRPTFLPPLTFPIYCTTHATLFFVLLQAFKQVPFHRFFRNFWFFFRFCY